MIHLKPEKRAIALMVLCSSLWSISGIFIKLIPWNAIVIAGWRSFFASICVVIYQRFSGMSFRLNRASVVSGLFMSASFFMFVTATKLTTAANAIVLQFTAPVFILIISVVFLKQSISRADFFTVLFTMGGISLFFFDQLSPGSLWGNCLAIGSGFTLAVMYLATGITDPQSRMSGIFIGQFLTAVIGIPFMFVYDTPITKFAVISILILGILQLGIPYVLYGIAVKHCPPLACSLLGAIEPLLNPVWVFLFSGECPGMFALFGGIVVIATITTWCIWRDKNVLSTANSDPN